MRRRNYIIGLYMKKNTQNRSLPYIVSSIARILVPLLIFRFPLPVLIGVTLLDLVDGDLAAFGGLRRMTYQIADKLLDFWESLFTLIYSYITLFPHIEVLIGLFVFRLLGVGLFLASKKEYYLVIFPNFYNLLFLLVFASHLFPRINVLFSGNAWYGMLALIAVLKIIQEYLIHIADFSVREGFFHSKRSWKV